jgi:amino acid permease
MIANQLGVSAAFVVFIGDNLNSMLKQFTLRECVGMSVPVLIVLSLIRDIRFLGKTSMIALSSLIIAVIVIFWTGLTNHPPIHKINYMPTNFFLFFGIAGKNNF